MSTIFNNSENNKTFELYMLVFNLNNEMDLQRVDKRVDLSNLSIY